MATIETHLHNDFVSGARNLARETGAVLGASADAALEYPYRALHDGEALVLGQRRLRVVATPGHTPEHMSELLYDPGGTPQALFSGAA